jgi:uncharacterized membrane-anchored protein YhcB (DUF1043 family)
MFLTVMLILAVLAGFAFGWLSMNASRERLTLSVEIERIRPAIDALKETTTGLFAKSKEIFEHSRDS